MHKRDYEMIARIVRLNAGNRRKLAEAFALELGQLSLAFDRAKFLKACGVKSQPPLQGPKRNATSI